jgi:hypothetical protein
MSSEMSQLLFPEEWPWVLEKLIVNRDIPFIF